jgi:hypothetical protein
MRHRGTAWNHQTRKNRPQSRPFVLSCAYATTRGGPQRSRSSLHWRKHSSGVKTNCSIRRSFDLDQITSKTELLKIGVGERPFRCEPGRQQFVTQQYRDAHLRADPHPSSTIICSSLSSGRCAKLTPTSTHWPRGVYFGKYVGSGRLFASGTLREVVELRTPSH